MELQRYIEEAFPAGLSYNDAAQLCLRLYSTVDNLPKALHSQCTKDTLAEVFARLAAAGYIAGGVELAALYGANFHATSEKGHWIEVIASLFKKSGIVDSELGEQVARRLTKQSSGRDEAS
jgi:hypothetical protein